MEKYWGLCAGSGPTVKTHKVTSKNQKLQKIHFLLRKSQKNHFLKKLQKTVSKLNYIKFIFSKN